MSKQATHNTKDFSSSCPACSSEEVERVSFTFWGGRLWPRLLNLHRCQSCGYSYNAKTGRSIKPFLRRIYMLALAIVLLAVAMILLTSAP